MRPILRFLLIGAAAALLCAACGRIDKLAEPLARPPILDWEPLPQPGSKADLAIQEYELQKAERRIGGLEPGTALEPTGSLPGRKSTVIAADHPKTDNRAERFLQPKQKPAPPRSVERPAPRPDKPVRTIPPEPSKPSSEPEPAAAQIQPPKAPALPEIALELPPPPLPEVTLNIAPEAVLAHPQACPPPDRDGVVRCPIFAGWSAGYDGGKHSRDDKGTALILLGTLIASGVFDLLRRLLRLRRPSSASPWAD